MEKSATVMARRRELRNEKIESILSKMQEQPAWDEMEAAAMDEAGRIQETELYDKAAAARREDIALVRSLLE